MERSKTAEYPLDNLSYVDEVMREFYDPPPKRNKYGKVEKSHITKHVQQKSTVKLAPINASDNFTNKDGVRGSKVVDKMSQSLAQSTLAQSQSEKRLPYEFMSLKDNLTHDMTKKPNKLSSDINNTSNAMKLALSPKEEKKATQSDINYTSSHVDLALSMQQVQAQVLQESQVLNDVLAEVQQCYAMLRDVSHTYLHQGRSEIGQAVDAINDNYIKLFEKMLEEVMKVQRTKFKSQTKLIESLKKELDSSHGEFLVLQDSFNSLDLERSALSKERDTAAQRASALQLDLSALQQQVKDIEQEKYSQKAEIFRLQTMLDRESKLSALKARADIDATLSSLHSEHKRDIDEMRRILALKEDELLELKEKTKKLENDASIFNNLDKFQFRRPGKDNDTQTEVQEDGLWDIQRGWVLPVSKTTAARIRWRRAFNFARCSSCRGIGKYIASVAKDLRNATIGTGNPQLGEEQQQQQLSDVARELRKWVMPDELVMFLSNLPQSVQAINPRGLLWTVHRSFVFMHFKCLADAKDRDLGYRPQPLLEFIIEQYLRYTETRSKAEIELYIFIKSLKEHYSSHPLLLLVARFLGLSDSLTSEEKAAFAEDRLRGRQALAKKKKESLETLKPRERQRLVDQEEAAKKDAVTSSSSSDVGSDPYYAKQFHSCHSSLPKEILPICLFARQCLLWSPYTGVYKEAIEAVREVTTSFDDSDKKLAKTASELRPRDESSEIALPAHLLFSKEQGCVFFVPLDRAIHVINAFVRDLPALEATSIARLMEESIFVLRGDGVITSTDVGMNSFIRSTVRIFYMSENETGRDVSDWEGLRSLYRQEKKDAAQSRGHSGANKTSGANDSKSSKKRSSRGAMSSSTSRDGSAPSSSAVGVKEGQAAISFDDESVANFNDKSVKCDSDLPMNDVIVPPEAFQHTLVISMDKILSIIADLALKRLGQVEQRLRTIFKEGDSNQDNVLGFEEFYSIVNRVHEKHSDRKALRMFREAIMLGRDKDSIGPQAFVKVCKDFHLIEIMDLEDMKSSSLSGLSSGRYLESRDKRLVISIPPRAKSREEAMKSETVESIQIRAPAAKPVTDVKADKSNEKPPKPTQTKPKETPIRSAKASNSFDDRKSYRALPSPSLPTTPLLAKSATDPPAPNVILDSFENQRVETPVNMLHGTTALPIKKKERLNHPTIEKILEPLEVNEPLSKKTASQMLAELQQRKQQHILIARNESTF